MQHFHSYSSSLKQVEGFATNRDFVILKQKEHQSSPIYNYIATAQEDYYIILYTKRQCEFHSNNNPVRLDVPTILFTETNHLHQIEKQISTFTSYVCMFQKSFISNKNCEAKQIIQQLKNNILFPLTNTQDEHCSFIFKKMLDELNHPYNFRKDVLTLYTELLVHKLNKLKDGYSIEPKKDAATRLTNKFLQLLDSQFTTNPSHTTSMLRTPNDFAEALFIHPNHLNFSINKTLNKSTTTCIKDRFLLEAKNKLTYTSLTISEIAYSLGYEHPTYFSNFFKKNTSMSPRQYRELNQF